MKKTLIISFILLTIVIPTFFALAQNNTQPNLAPDEFYLGKVTKILDEGIDDSQGQSLAYQKIIVKILNGQLKNKEVEIKISGSGTVLPAYQKVTVGEKVVVVKNDVWGDINYYLVEKYRLTPIILILIIFFGLVILFSRLKGLSSIIGLIISILIIALFIVPRIVNGHDPLITGLLGALMIALLSIYTAHGFNKRTSVALLSTLLTLGLSAILAISFVSMAKLFGLGSEEAFFLGQLGPFETINLRGLLLAGIIIGALGVLDDITTSQTAAIDEIKKANFSLSFKELYERGISVGKEHISSLVNTLMLAYAGASLPLFLLFFTNKDQPLWVVLNSEFIVEEVIRALVGSTALVLAVPISTFLAAYFLSKTKSTQKN